VKQNTDYAACFKNSANFLDAKTHKMNFYRCVLGHLTTNSQTGKFSPFKHVLALSEWKKRVPLHSEIFKFSVFIMTDLVFNILVLNASMGLKVCLKFTCN
jgi:hypothetical protein